MLNVDIVFAKFFGIINLVKFNKFLLLTKF